MSLIILILPLRYFFQNVFLIVLVCCSLCCCYVVAIHLVSTVLLSWIHQTHFLFFLLNKGWCGSTMKWQWRQWPSTHLSLRPLLWMLFLLPILPSQPPYISLIPQPTTTSSPLPLSHFYFSLSSFLLLLLLRDCGHRLVFQPTAIKQCLHSSAQGTHTPTDPQTHSHPYEHTGRVSPEYSTHAHPDNQSPNVGFTGTSYSTTSDTGAESTTALTAGQLAVG